MAALLYADWDSLFCGLLTLIIKFLRKFEKPVGMQKVGVRTVSKSLYKGKWFSVDVSCLARHTYHSSVCS